MKAFSFFFAWLVDCYNTCYDVNGKLPRQYCACRFPCFSRWSFRCLAAVQVSYECCFIGTVQNLQPSYEVFSCTTCWEFHKIQHNCISWKYLWRQCVYDDTGHMRPLLITINTTITLFVCSNYLTILLHVSSTANRFFPYSGCSRVNITKHVYFSVPTCYLLSKPMYWLLMIWYLFFSINEKGAHLVLTKSTLIAPSLSIYLWSSHWHNFHA
jgi:hypothetical protein